MHYLKKQTNKKKACTANNAHSHTHTSYHMPTAQYTETVPKLEKNKKLRPKD